MQADTTRYIEFFLSRFSSVPVHPEKNLVPTTQPRAWIRGLDLAARPYPPRPERARPHTHGPLVKRPAAPCRAVARALRLVAPLSAGPPTHTLTHAQHNVYFVEVHTQRLLLVRALGRGCGGTLFDPLCVGMRAAVGRGEDMFIVYLACVGFFGPDKALECVGFFGLRLSGWDECSPCGRWDEYT